MGSLDSEICFAFDTLEDSFFEMELETFNVLGASLASLRCMVRLIRGGGGGGKVVELPGLDLKKM